MKMTSLFYILVFYILTFVVQSQKIYQSSCLLSEWQKDMQQQMNGMQLLLQNYAVKISNLEEKLNSSNEKKKTLHETTTYATESETSKNVCYLSLFCFSQIKIIDEIPHD